MESEQADGSRTRGGGIINKEEETLVDRERDSETK
jgi:hypothetical protein